MSQGEPLQQKLQELDEKAETLQKQGRYGESLDVFEEILTLKQNYYGEDSEQYYKTSEKLCELCNLIAMICLDKQKFDASLDFLKKAEIISINSPKQKAITYNNLACYYRKTNKLRTALQYLEKALKIEISLEINSSLADTHLNLCAVLSQLGRHQEALEHVLFAIMILQDEFYETSLQKNEEKKEGDQDQQDQEGGEEQDQQKQTPFGDRTQVLSIAYHNLGVELEYLKRYEEAIQTYTKAVNFARKIKGEQDPLVENLENVRQTAINQIQQQKSKENKRKNVRSTGGFHTAQKMNKLNDVYQDPSQRPKTYASNSNFNRTMGGTKGTNFYSSQGMAQNSQRQKRQNQGQSGGMGGGGGQQSQRDYDEEEYQNQQEQNIQQQQQDSEQYQNQEDNLK